MTGIIRRVSAILFAVIFTFSMPIAAYAIDVNVSYGDVSVGDTQVTHTKEAGGSAVTEDHGGSVTVTGTTTENNISVNVSAGNTVEVTLQDVNIDAGKGKAAMEISGAGNVVVELEGTNTLEGANSHAGLQTSQDGGSLVIQDEVPNEDGKTASLTAKGGNKGAGIGGGPDGNGSNIEITGGVVTATGGSYGAGIGGGQDGNGSNITISGGEVTATGNTGGAGIGGGQRGDCSGIAISGGKVTATSSSQGAGIGGGNGGSGSDIEISGGTVEATGGRYGAGIGAGNGIDSTGSNIKISGGEVVATGGANAAGIGGGNKGSGSDIAISGGTVEATGGDKAAGIGGGGNSGSGNGGTGENISISGGTVEATGGNNAAGIGGGNGSAGESISISGDAQVTASGSGTAADVGGGAQTGDTAKQENNVDTSGLYTTGSFTDSTGEEVKGEVVPPAPVPETPAAPVVSNDYYYVQAPTEPYTVSVDYTKTEKDGVLTLTVKGEEAELEITAEGIRELIADGVHTLVFVTDKAETELDLDELVKDCADTDVFVISHKGDVTTITLNGEEVK